MTRENSRSQSMPWAAATTVQRDTARNSAICGCRPDASDVGGWDMTREHTWLPNMTCSVCRCWGMTYEARMSCRGEDVAVEPEPPAPVDWLELNKEFSA